MQEDLTKELVSKAKELLASGKVKRVVGWRRGLFDYDVTPGVFTDAGDIEKNFVYNQWCGANLSKYLVKITREIEIAKSTTRTNNVMAKQRDPNAQDAPIPQEMVLVFLKPCDTYSFTELLKENRINRDDVYVVGVPCNAMADPESGKEAERCTNCK
ncbi:MAG: 4Fe-4S ferredoxin, partial [Treponema sp.]|nr:4Fe-4S ferredoxin [Treponema sp.]